MRNSTSADVLLEPGMEVSRPRMKVQQPLTVGKVALNVYRAYARAIWFLFSAHVFALCLWGLFCIWYVTQKLDIIVVRKGELPAAHSTPHK